MVVEQVVRSQLVLSSASCYGRLLGHDWFSTLLLFFEVVHAAKSGIGSCLCCDVVEFGEHASYILWV